LDWGIIALNFVYAVLGVVLMFVSYRVFDWLTPTIDYAAELRKGNVAVGIFIAALFLGIAIIIGGALN
jgi:putative membrane protein